MAEPSFSLMLGTVLVSNGIPESAQRPAFVNGSAPRRRARLRSLRRVVAHLTQRAGPALDQRARATLRAGWERAVRRAGRGEGEVLVGLTVQVAPSTDPSAVAFASRRDGEPWFCFE